MRITTKKLNQYLNQLIERFKVGRYVEFTLKLKELRTR